MDEKALFKLSYGIYAVTSWGDGVPTGCIVNSAMQVTAEPPMIAMSVNHDSFTNGCIINTGLFALNILGEDTDPSLIGRFGFRSGRDFNKFGGIEPVIKNSLPILPEAIAFLICKVVGTTQTPTHTIFLAEVTECENLSEGMPMTYKYYREVIKGSAPESAPTYSAVR